VGIGARIGAMPMGKMPNGGVATQGKKRGLFLVSRRKPTWAAQYHEEEKKDIVTKECQGKGGYGP